jgi:hypothetical protein
MAIFKPESSALPFPSSDRKKVFEAITQQALARSPFNSGSYGSGVRAMVFEVIVRQALAGAPWRKLFVGPMKVNNITVEEVQAEVDRRSS